MSTALEKISGMGGFKVVTSFTDGQYESLVTNQDTTFTVFAINGVDCLASHGLSGVTIKAGTYLPTDPGKKITAATGSAAFIAYL